MKKFIIPIILGATCCSGFVIGKVSERLKTKKCSGHLQIDTSENNESPKIFLVLDNDDILKINSSKFITLKVVKKNFM